jgi:hypothetical protein
MVKVGNLDIDSRIILGYFHTDMVGIFLKKYNQSNGYDDLSLPIDG